MATLTANSLITRASILLQDTTHVRWPRAELLKWLNDGQRVIALMLPDSFTKVGVSVASSGAGSNPNTEKLIPDDGIRLIDVIRNTTSKRAVRQIDRSVLDTQYPNWQNTAAATEAKHFSFDKRNPKRFFVYPPTTDTFDVVYSASPVEITIATEGSVDSAGSTEVILLDDVFGTALVDFMVYRAYLKDAEYAANDSRSQSAYQTFLASLTGKRAADEFAVPTEEVTIAGVRHTPYRQ